MASGNTSLAQLPILVRKTVFVEDEETSGYLKKLFPVATGLLDFAPVGGSNGVQFRLNAVNSSGSGVKAFGILDRDYGPNRSASWTQPTTYTFVLKRHEIENYALDWAAIEKVIGNPAVTAQTIETYAHQIAADYVFTVACNAYLADLEQKIQQSRPKEKTVYPKPIQQLSPIELQRTLPTLADAIAYVDQSILVAWIRNQAPQQLSLQGITADLTSKVATMQTSLANGNWPELFPGKEILRAVRMKWLSAAEDSDFLCEIGQQQQSNPSKDLSIIINAIISR